MFDRFEVTPSSLRLAMVTLPIALILGTSDPASARGLAPIWAGAYFGAHGGALLADIDTRNFGSFDTARAAFGGHAGYTIGLGSLMLGIEGDASYGGSRFFFATTAGGTATVETDWSGTIRGRLGTTVGPALLYLTAGWAWSGLSIVERTGGGTAVKREGSYTGVVYGVGAESFLLPGLSMRLEALRYDLGTEQLSVSGGIGALQAIDRTDTVIRAGITLHFK
jgi:outer membrane immunogenic protein